MAQENDILLIFEDGVFREHCVRYAVELARRMKCSISVLMMMNTGSEGAANKSALDRVVESVLDNGIGARGSVRYGDKASEFLKHLALSPPFATLIWGGDEELLITSSRKKTEHWLSKVTGQVGYPIVTPAQKGCVNASAVVVSGEKTGRG